MVIPTSVFVLCLYCSSFIGLAPCVAQLTAQSLKALESKTFARRFVKSHVVPNFWLLRDIVGQSYTPWMKQNVERHAPKQLVTITGKVRSVFRCDNWGKLNCINIIQAFTIGIKGSLGFDGSRDIFLGREFKPGVAPARLVTSDIRCHNGVIHLIDSVIIHEPAAKAKVNPENALQWLDEELTENSDDKETSRIIPINM